MADAAQPADAKPTPMGTNAPPPYQDKPYVRPWTWTGHGANANLPVPWPPWHVYPLLW